MSFYPRITVFTPDSRQTIPSCVVYETGCRGNDKSARPVFRMHCPGNTEKENQANKIGFPGQKVHLGFVLIGS